MALIILYVLDVGRYALQQDDVDPSYVSRGARLRHLLVENICRNGRDTASNLAPPPILRGAPSDSHPSSSPWVWRSRGSSSAPPPWSARRCRPPGGCGSPCRCRTRSAWRAEARRRSPGCAAAWWAWPLPAAARSRRWPYTAARRDAARLLQWEQKRCTIRCDPFSL